MRQWTFLKRTSWLALLLAIRMLTPSPVLADADDLAARSSGRAADAARPARWGEWSRWGDQGDGTYRNPVLPSDYSDLDCIRVGPDYYAISSTFQYSPGMVILHSKDLVNWRILGHVIEDVTQIGPELNWNRMNRYGRGVWAGAIRHHAGKFWLYFGTPDEGYFMSTANDPAGPWEPLHRVTNEPGWDDCCPFWDDDGQGYFVGTHFKGGYKTWLFKLTPDGRNVVAESRVLLNEGSGREANKLYKINGTYYHFYSEHNPGVGRYVMMQRATNIAGPYTGKRQLSHAQREAHEPNQGGIVQTGQGDWYFFTHHGAGDWEGRPASLLPVTWVDGWPIIGEVGSEGLGKMVWSGRKPVANASVITPQTDDEFNGPKLGVQWEWNYQPRADKWSLTERPGWLRLHAWKPLRPDDLKRAGNTLTQRTMRTRTNVVTVELDPAGMADGQVAGLCHYNRNYATIAVRCDQGVRTIEAARNQKVLSGPKLAGKPLWLRSEWGLDGVCRFSYSTDGKTFASLGEPYQFGWGDYRGERIGLFSYNNSGEAGHADFGSFTYHYDSPLTFLGADALGVPPASAKPALVAAGLLADAEGTVRSAEMADASRVRLLPGSPFYDRQELHRTGYVGQLDPDRLLFDYRKLAGLPQPAGITAGYGGWDGGFIKGHMAGHYLSAASRMAAATGDESFHQKAAYLVAELANCQQALKQDGYLAAFPSIALDWQEGTSKNSGGVVVPYYTIHKIMAGLVDAHRYLGNRQALDVALKMSAYLQKRLFDLPPEQIERMFRTDRSRNPQTEFGGMADVLTELYSVTGDKKHLELAALFNRPWLLDPLAANEDRLKSLHANTHVAQLAGIARYANVTGDATNARASENAWAIITRHHSFTLGGNSYKEWFDGPDVEAGPSIDDGKRLPPTTAESCNTQNMLKLTARLIERAPDRADYGDYFERALYNHLLATIAPDTGTMTYFTPLRGDFRTYLDGTHCCVGSGIENTARYNEGIYFQNPGQLWVNLYIPSAFNWADQGLAIKQEGFPPFTDTVRLTVTHAARPADATLHLRVPGWLSGPVELSVNDRPQAVTATPSSYLAVKRIWKTGDVVTLKLPSALRLERAKDVPSMVSVFYGPVLLAGRLGADGMPKDFADKDAYLKLPSAPVPAVVNASANPADWLTLADASTLTFKAHAAGPATGIVFQPLYAVHHERYSVYWELAATAAQTSAPGNAAKDDAPALDRVLIGDAASERAHDLSAERSQTGRVANYTWRDAAPDGFFSYVFALPSTPKPALVCTYWGSDRDRTFDIVVNGVIVTTQILDGRQPGKAIEVIYPLPPEAITGQQNLTVRFQGTGKGRVGGLLGLRLEPARP